MLALGADKGGGHAAVVLGPLEAGLPVLVAQCGHIFLRLAGGVLLTVKAHSGGVGGHALLGASGPLGHRRGSLSGGSLLVAAVLPVTDEGSGDAGVAFSPGKGRLAVGMRLKHRGNGDSACGHLKGVFCADRHITLYNPPLHKVVAIAGNGSQSDFVADSSSGGVSRSCTALHRAGHGDGVCSLGQGDLQLIQLRRLGLRTGEHQGARSGLVHYQLELHNVSGARIVRSPGGDRPGGNLLAAPGQLVGSGAAAVAGYHGVGARHRSIVIEGNGVLLVEAVDELAVAGPGGVIGHFQGPLAVRTQDLIVQLAKLSLQGGSLALVGEHKGIRSGVLRPLHQVSHGSLDGLLGIGKGCGGRILPCQYLFGIGNGLGIGIPAALVPLRLFAVGLVHQGLEFMTGILTGPGADHLPQAGPWPSVSRLQVHSHISSDLTHRNRHPIIV